METNNVRAVLFVKDLRKVASFYIGALGMTSSAAGDDNHAMLECDGFALIVHQIPKAIADTIVVTEPPVRRVWGAIRLDFPVSSVGDSRRLARSLGGDVDEVPAWTDSGLFFGYDPEGNQFGVCERG
jgi:predicted enzyme related to lactoylglutathione lyase